MKFSGLDFGFSSLSSALVSLRFFVTKTLCQQAAVRLAAFCRCGRCGGPHRLSFSAGARVDPPVSRSARHASMFLALPDRGSPWEPSRAVTLTRSLKSGSLVVCALAAAWRNSLAFSNFGDGRKAAEGARARADML